MLRDKPDEKNVKCFQSAVDHRLSGLREDPYLARRIIANEGREKQVKKKLSLGMILAMTMILVVSAVLAENWPDISDYFANGLPDRVTQPSGNGIEESKAEGTVIQRHVIESVYAPVRVHVVNDAGEETCAFDLTPQVAQVEYHYTILHRTDGTWTVEPDISFIGGADQQYGNQALNPFAPYLFISGKLDSGSYDFSVYQWHDYRLDFTKYRATVSYIKELYLNEQGQIVRTVQDDMVIRLGLVDDNGTLPENCFEAMTQAFPNSEGLDSVRPTPVPLPSIEPAAMNDGLQYGGTQDAEYYDTLLFGAPYTLHYTGENGIPLEAFNDECTNMTAHFNRQQFELLTDFGKQDGLVETDYELLLLGSFSTSDGGIISFQQLEKPDVTVSYQEDAYTVRFSGGKFRVQYPTDLYYSPEAYHQTGSGIWQFTVSSAYLTNADYAEEEYPYDFTFRLMNPLNFHTVETFGSELPPITHHYIEADGTEKEWELQADHFEVSIQEKAVLQLVNFSESEQVLNYQDRFISIQSNAIPDLPQVTVLEEPECVVRPLSNGYEMRVTGGLMRLRYLSVIWRQEAEDGTIILLDAPDGWEMYTTVEIPFDFTFTVPVYK
ncbi:MAG: hypothetical protein IJQ62_03995 [Clostridia bacterium]|nr:hypothetical protein [Clostridia bacterium]